MRISKSEFARRRKNFMSLMEPNSIAIIPSAKEQLAVAIPNFRSVRTATFTTCQALTSPNLCWY